MRALRLFAFLTAIGTSIGTVATIRPSVPDSLVERIDYTGNCGASYTCVNGTTINCQKPPNGSRPREQLTPVYVCGCEKAAACK
jgi:hypothetical protein